MAPFHYHTKHLKLTSSPSTTTVIKKETWIEVDGEKETKQIEVFPMALKIIMRSLFFSASSYESTKVKCQKNIEKFILKKMFNAKQH